MGCERIALEEWWVLYLVQVWRVSIPTRRHELLSLHQKYPFSSDIASSGRENVEDWFLSWWQFAHMPKQCERCAGTWIGSPKSFFSQVVCSGEGGRQCLAGTENFGEIRIWKTDGHRRKEGNFDQEWCWKESPMMPESEAVVVERESGEEWLGWSSTSSPPPPHPLIQTLKLPRLSPSEFYGRSQQKVLLYSSFMINPVPHTEIKVNFPHFPHLKKDWSET